MERSISIWVKQKGTFVVLLICLVTMGSCHKKKSQALKKSDTQNEMKKFEWRPTESAPKNYPIEIYKGIIGCEDGSMHAIPSGGRTVHNGWGETGSTYVVGDDFKSVPKNLHISWLSFTENKFYIGDFKLPSDEIRLLFENGFTDHKGNHDTYSNLIVGMAPGGYVSIWLFGAGKSVEIGQFKASETEVSMEDFNPNGIQDRSEYVASTLENLSDDIKTYLREHSIETDKWSIYRKKYVLKFGYQFQNLATPADIRVAFFDGSHFYFQPTNPEISDYNTWPIPKKINYQWYDKKKNKFGADIELDESEIFKGFYTLFKEEESTRADLIIKVNSNNSDLEILLESGKRSITLSKAQIKIYPTSD